MGQHTTSREEDAPSRPQSEILADLDIIDNTDVGEDPIRIDVPKLVPTSPHREKPQRPRRGGIGLALGGGVARGWAHIGVLRAFDEAGIEISMIAGTSVGALVGGYYLAGKLDDLESFARSITRAKILRYMDFSLRGSGLISGQRLANRMARDIGTINIEDIDKPFVAVATEIKTGHEIWLEDGPLDVAIRCSYALPGIFEPVAHCGKFLVDGAIVNPVPVSACRAYEPDVVIAINLNSETFGKGTVIRSSCYDHSDILDPAKASSDIKASPWYSLLNRGNSGNKIKAARLGVTGVMMEAFNIIQDRIARTRLAGDPPDFTIRPRLKELGLTEFNRADEAIDMGYQEGVYRIGEMKRHEMLQQFL